jgi:hypothetical protein
MVNLGVGSQTGLDGQHYYYSTVGGGWSTKARHNFATVAGGDRNNAGGEHSTIGGGRANEIKIAATRSTIAGGNGNIANSSSSFIGGGGANQTFGNDAVVVGGWDNDAYGYRSFIGGGSWNRTEEDYASIQGGHNNYAFGYASNIGGGREDTVSGSYSVIAGGYGNYASGWSSGVGAGSSNNVSASNTFIGGGGNNLVAAQFSSILGGRYNTIAATAEYSYLFGLNSTLTQDSTFMVDMPHIQFGDETDGYEFPPSDGSAGQSMVTDGAGHVGWSSVSGTSGLTLPYNDTVSTSGYTFSVTNNGAGDGAYFQSGGFSRQAVHGVATGTLGKGITGIGNGQHGIGVYGRSNDFSDGDAYGGKFESFGLNGRGAYGIASGNNASGVYGEATGTEGRAVSGWANNIGNVTNFGGHFVANGQQARGVYGQASNQGGYVTYGGYFESNSSIGVGVYGLASSTHESVHYGGLFEANGYNSVAVKGYSEHSVGVWAESVDGVAFAAKSSGLAADFDGDVRVRAGNEFMLGNVAIVDDTVITPTVHITGGSDLSESFNVTSGHGKTPVQPGMLVCIDETNAGQLKLSERAYDPRVAGVISGAGGVQPGMLMGQAGTIADGDNSVALVGRVYCWADADYGEIKPGDMMTTSNTPGHAMRAEDRDKAYGTIVGKAMTPLPEGRGLVLVLVGLQ